MTYIEILEKWAKFTNYDPEQTKFNMGSYDIHRASEMISSICSDYDETGMVAALYVKDVFLNKLHNKQVTLLEIWQNPEKYSNMKKMWDVFHSKEIAEAETLLVQHIEKLVAKVVGKKMIGQVDVASERDKLVSSMESVIRSLSKCKTEVFLKGGKILPITNISTQIHVFGDIAHCLLALEGAGDGLYLCYIDNNKNVTGFFGFFIKSNGNIFSVNERIVEAYAGQNTSGNRRNNRFAEAKQYDLFPYDYIFDYGGYDYKGIAGKHMIDDEKLEFFNLGSHVYLKLVLAIMLIVKKFEGTELDCGHVYVDSLMETNRERLESTGLMVIENSRLLDLNSGFRIDWSSEDIMNNVPAEGGKRFNNESLHYTEKGQFIGHGQIFVELYGGGFEFDPSKVFERQKVLLKLEGETEEEESTAHDPLIGTKNYMELQAYFQARKQLAEYVAKNMQEEMESFLESIKEYWDGRHDKASTGDWYIAQLERRRDAFVELVTEIEAAGMEQRPGADERSGLGELNPDFWTYSTDLYRVDKYGENYKSYDGYKHEPWSGTAINEKHYRNRQCYPNWICPITENRANVWYKFTPLCWEGIEFFLSKAGVPLPKIIKGYKTRDREGMWNSILSTVDPMAHIITPFEHRGSFTYDRHAFDFKFELGFSKRGLNKLLSAKK